MDADFLRLYVHVKKLRELFLSIGNNLLRIHYDYQFTPVIICITGVNLLLLRPI